MINKPFDSGSTLMNEEAEEIKDFVDLCIEKSINEAVYQVFENGGYYVLPNASINENIPYYFDNKMMIPSKEEIESEISEYFKMSLFICTKNFIDFRDLDIEKGDIIVDTKVLDSDISFKVEYLVKVTRGEESYILKEFDSNVEGRFDLIYSFAKEIVEDYEFYDAVCLNCILDRANEEDLYVEFFDFEESYIFVITDYNTIIDEKPIKFYFAIK
jgi:hypothetical protein